MLYQEPHSDDIECPQGFLPDPEAVNPVSAVPRCRVEKRSENEPMAMNARPCAAAPGDGGGTPVLRQRARNNGDMNEIYGLTPPTFLYGR
jgi:hypothetical protein